MTWVQIEFFSLGYKIKHKNDDINYEKYDDIYFSFNPIFNVLLAFEMISTM